MKRNRMIHTPEGFRDLYGDEARARRKLLQDLDEVFRRYGYEDIETPAVEYFDVFGSDVGTTPSNELYKFFDRDGNTLVLRPDFTPSVARAVAMHFSPDAMPYRLSYKGNTYVNSQEYQLNLKEQLQMGVELIGDASAEADAEILMLTCDLLKTAGLKEFQVSCGNNDYFRALAEESGLAEDEIEAVRQLTSNKNFFGVSELMEGMRAPDRIREAFVKMPQLFGGEEVLAEAEKYAASDGMHRAIGRLSTISGLMAKHGYAQYLTYDFGLLSKYHYYTGMIFSAYTYGTGDAVAKGGRYDTLLMHFGMDAPAVGVGLYIDQLRSALLRQGARSES